MNYLFQLYTTSRNVTTLEDLKDLIVADRLKATLNHATRVYIADKEASTQKKWMKFDKISALVDTYESEITQNTYKPERRANQYKSKEYAASYNNNDKNYGKFSNSSKSESYEKPAYQQQDKQTYQQRDKSRIRCSKCLNFGHSAEACTRQTSSRRCHICNDPTHLRRNCPQNRNANQNQFNNGRKFGHSSRVHVETEEVVNLSSSREPGATGNKESIHIDRVTQKETNTELSVSTYKSETDHKPTHGVLVPHDLNISIDFGRGPRAAYVDSGSDMTIVTRDMIPDDIIDECENQGNSMVLIGAFGEMAKAIMANIPVCMPREDNKPSPKVMLTCALTERLARGVALVSLSDYEILKSAQKQMIPQVELLTDLHVPYTDPTISRDQNARRLETIAVMKSVQEDLFQAKQDNGNQQEHYVNAISTQMLGAEMLQSVNSSEFREQQLTDETLQQCWIESRKPNTEFHKDETSQLLYRHTVIGGFEIKQLVVPKEQRDSVISLAHDSLWAMHFAHKKTYHRVRAYFYWPKMSNGIKVGKVRPAGRMRPAEAFRAARHLGHTCN